MSVPSYEVYSAVFHGVIPQFREVSRVTLGELLLCSLILPYFHCLTFLGLKFH